MFRSTNISEVTMDPFPSNPIHGNISLGKHGMEGLFDPGPDICASLIFTPYIALPMKYFCVSSHNKLSGIFLLKYSQKPKVKINIRAKAIPVYK